MNESYKIMTNNLKSAWEPQKREEHRFCDAMLEYATEFEQLMQDIKKELDSEEVNDLPTPSDSI